MSFSLESVLAMCQRAKDVTLVTIKWQGALVNTDDTNIFLKTPKEHLRQIEEELKLLIDAKIAVTFKKCSLSRGTINYFSAIVKPGKLHGVARTTETLKF